MGERVLKLAEETQHELKDVIDNHIRFKDAVAKGELTRISEEAYKLGIHYRRLEELSTLAQIWKEN